MANYYGVGRTNYFKLNEDKKALFLSLINLFDIRTNEREDGSIAIISEQEDGGLGGFLDLEDKASDPEYVEEVKYVKEHIQTREDHDEDIPDEALGDVELYISDIVGDFLAPEQVYVEQIAGNEKNRYICGHSVAVAPGGQQVVINLGDIYQKCRDELKIEPQSRAEY